MRSLSLFCSEKNGTPPIANLQIENKPLKYFSLKTKKFHPKIDLNYYRSLNHLSLKLKPLN